MRRDEKMRRDEMKEGEKGRERCDVT